MIKSSEVAQPVQSAATGGRERVRFPAVLAQLPVTLYVFLAAALLVTAMILASRLPRSELGPFLYAPAVAAAILLLVALWSLVALRGREYGNALAILAASLGLSAGLCLDAFHEQILVPAWIFGNCLASAALLDLTLAETGSTLSMGRLRPWRWLMYVVGLAVATFVTLTFLSGPTLGRALPALWFLLLAALIHTVVHVLQAFSAPALVLRTQASLGAAGAAFSFAPLAVWAASGVIGGLTFSPFVWSSTIALPLVLAYTMHRFSMAGTTRWLRQGVIFGIVSAMILGGYALLVSGISLITGSLLPSVGPIWLGAFAVLAALLLQPVRARVQEVADRTFFRGQRAVDDTVQRFTRQFSGALGLNEISRSIHEAAASSVDSTNIHVFHYDALNDQFAALPDASGRPTSELRFPGSGPLASQLTQQSLPLHVDEGALPANLQPERSRLSILGTRLILPLPGRDRSLGWITLGSPRSGTQYSSSDILVLEQLAGQAALAMSRIETVEQLQRRLQEMNALTRVAQGVNITLTYDDVLELIYAQTSQIVPCTYFRITLHRSEEDYVYLAFAVDDKERLVALENKPLPPKAGLSREVIHRGRPIVTQDYESQCRTLGVEPAAKGISAWMGVPLSAGAESIGALSVGNREPGAVYTPAQLDLLHAVADQTAGAIVKARLLRETQQRATQLGKLNEVARQLASIRTLEGLRRAVVDGAIAILECEGGIFYGVDQPAGELTVEAAGGSVDPGIVGEALPIETGTAGAVVSGRRAVTENDRTRGSGTHLLNRLGAGLVPRTSLAVPLIVQDSIIGVLELLNRNDGNPFDQEDQSVVLAFSGQAAAALENLRLYMLTDQELAARVEELSVMQRIDRELNASLEMDRAMRITLEWALRQSGADAGLIGLLEGDRLRVVTELGYGRSVGDPRDQKISLALPGLQQAIDSGLPQRVRFEVGTGGFLPAADHQVAVPIRREANVIGLLILESLSATQEDVSFLSRLSDHAAIAISNAQLYDEVQRANVAKSDFVSLVAHELKNPMTSIKGYTELLVAGAVGEVNEMQAGFLNTIRSNTERMSTLVSDLNDNSKIEAGRLRLDFKAVELGEVIDETVRSTRRQIDEKKQSVQLELPETLPPVWSDRTRLGQVLTNLISNATKYTPEGGLLLIGAERSTNHWDPGGATNVVHMWVRDNGIGIGPEDQQKIFQKFFRSEDPKAREAPGAGLGLNITRSLVEMQGGRIWFESQYRQGATFHFTIPVAEA